MLFTVYTSPTCHKCKLTASRLEKAGHEVELIDTTVVAGARDEALAISGGVLTLPIVKPAEGEPWSDFRVDRLKEYGA
ncbi:hypothetical protein CH253_08240 [Rhodococcus sp. 06-156-3C]|uniref:glutaredoxin family protein n=1 Tax=Rhodococcus sp. 06-156-3C TaxID=2022486 RepID=UPI000B9B5EC0|nr:hypothetical protein CH253_08240 [Rhodococcus sp. 06-156-3C]